MQYRLAQKSRGTVNLKPADHVGASLKLTIEMRCRGA